MSHFRERFPSTPAVEGTIVSSFLAGCFVGALASGYFADRFGRRFSILGGSLIFAVGSVLQATSGTFAQLYIGRIVSGISIGILSMMVPLYQSEISPKEIRGRLVSLQQFSITIGIAVSFWIDYGSAKIDSHAQWQIPLGIQCVPAVLLAIGTTILPFSPRWLLDHDRDDEALIVLAKLRANGDKNDPIVIEEYNEIKENVRFEREIAAKSYFELIKKGPENIRKRIILGIAIQAFQQLTGINAIMYYAPQIFTSAGLGDTSSSLLATGINGIVNMVATIPAILWIDTWGRKPTLTSGGILMGIFMLIVGIILAVHGTVYYDSAIGKHSLHIDSPVSSYSVIVLIYLFVASFAYSWGPGGWIYPAEIFPLRIRGKALSITTASNWLFNFVIGQVVPILLDRILQFIFSNLTFYLTFLLINTNRTYIIFGILCLIMGVSMFLFFPETKGKTLEEMDSIFGNVKSALPTHTDSRRAVENTDGGTSPSNVKQEPSEMRKIEQATDIETKESKPSVGIAFPG
ncbi:28580_t:CDS:10 [Dentiscutata erythropus]|uniref:28580_t:CDS:1 n=1 Tax=Dentiscutata erythropus TaxID=1348616 RepID=A0A9N9BLW1_9GLOM|nr:28580_t:CDS:10 [Dentiscutata erythropus]